MPKLEDLEREAMEAEQARREQQAGGLKGLLGRLFQRGEDAAEEPDDYDVIPAPGSARHARPAAPAPATPEEEEARRREALRLEHERLVQDNTMPVRNHRLYKLYCQQQGMLPEEDKDASFSLSVFMEDGQLASREQREWLNGFDRGLRSLLSYGDARNPRPVDTQVYVRIGSDRLSAWLFMIPPSYGGAAPTVEGIVEQLLNLKISYGVDMGKIVAACEGERYLTLIKVAEGKPQLDGLDGQVFDYFRRDTEINLVIKDDDTIDYRDLGWLQTVYAGDIICEITEPVPPKDGISVRGDELRGKPGRKARPPVGPGTVLSEDGGTLTAAIDGVVTFQENRFRVDPLLIVRGDVNAEIGNLDMVGDIIVQGDVREGFIIWATGHIAVQGMVEASQLQAGGNIQIGRGMNGAGRGWVRAGGNVVCKFLENVRVEAGGKVITDSIVNSNVASDDAVEAKTGRGAIVGGAISALNRVEAKTVGNPSNRSTKVRLGSTMAYLDQWAALQDKRDVAAQALHDVEKNIMFVEYEGTPGANKKQLEELETSRMVQSRQLTMMDRRLELMRLRVENRDESRLVAETIYPPAHVTIGGESNTFVESMVDMEIGLFDGAVDAKPQKKELTFY